MSDELASIEQLAGQLRDQRSAVRGQALATLAMRPAGDPGARELAPLLVQVFAAEKTRRLRRELSRQIVRHLDASVAPDGVVDEIIAQLSAAKTRGDRHAALLFAELAAEKGWDLRPAVPALVDQLQAGWAREALSALRLVERSHGGVLGIDWEEGYPVGEVLHVMFEQPSGAVRHECVRMVHESARRGDPRAQHFLPEVEAAAADTRMIAQFHQDATACLAALRAL